MVVYKFRYSRKSRKYLYIVTAETGGAAFREIARFLSKDPIRKLVPDSIKTSGGRRVEDPENIMAYLSHVTKKEAVKVMSNLSKSTFKIPNSLKI